MTEQYTNNPIEADHGRLKARPDRCAASNVAAPRVISSGHAFVQNLRRGHYELGMTSSPAAGSRRFTELARAI